MRRYAPPLLSVLPTSVVGSGSSRPRWATLPARNRPPCISSTPAMPGRPRRRLGLSNAGFAAGRRWGARAPAPRSPVDAGRRAGVWLRGRPLPKCPHLGGGGDRPDHGVPRLAERPPVWALPLRAGGDCGGNPAAGREVAADGRSRAPPALERRASRSRRLPPPRWRRRLAAERVDGFRAGLRRASAAALPDHRRASPGSGGLMGETLRLDRIRCGGHGLFAELLPEMIHLDDWGYPIIAAGAGPASPVGHARPAPPARPVLALRLARSANGRLRPVA